mmetsp:Transcript_17125/g.56020  ORF Transcript_17125/g.56020 Transcript_17125/m.56020 type:complete len:331 (-) Transcript_17125:77-1069(-)
MWWRVVGLLALLPLRLAAYSDDGERLPGWQGEVHSITGQAVDDSNDPQGIPPFGTRHTQAGRLELLSWAPRAYLYHGLLTPSEADYFIEKAKPNMKKSTVVDNGTGKSIDSQIRTSTGTFFRRQEDDVIADVERRIAEFTMIPVENGEGIQILHYVKGQKYEAHYDYFHDKFNAEPAKGGNRIATVLIYLSDVEEGGETVFPSSGDKPEYGDDPSWSQCAKRGLAVHPRKGDAMLFFSLDLTGKLDTHSLHASCPVIRGEKWSATKWIHVAEFGGAKKKRTGPCKDENANCANWAKAGECTKNAPFMLGDDFSDGQCLVSCKACPASASS